MTTTYWFRNTNCPTGPGGELSPDTDDFPAEPADKNTEKDMGYTIGAAQTSVVGSYNNTGTNRMSMMRLFVGPALGPQTLTGAQAGFEIGIAALESSPQMNLHFRTFVYVWRSGTGNVKTIISATSHATEVTSVEETGYVITAQGAAGNFAIQQGDRIVVEIWADLPNTKSVAYDATIWWDGTTQVQDQVATGDAGSYFYSPQTLYEAGSEELLAKFSVQTGLTSGSEDLLAKLEVKHSDSEEFLCKADVQHSDSAELLAKFQVSNSSSAELFARGEIQQSGSAEFLAKADIQHSDLAELLGKGDIQHSGTAELLGKADIQHSDSSDLLGKTEVQQSGSAELLGKADIQHSDSAELLGKFQVSNSSSAELFARGEIQQSGSAEFLAKADIQQAGSAELLGKTDIQHSDSVELLSKSNIQQSGLVELLGKTEVQQSGFAELLCQLNVQAIQTDSEDLLSKLEVKQTSSEELLGKLLVGAEDSENLYSRFEIQNTSSQDLYARFEVGQDSADLYARFELQASVDLFARFDVRAVGSAELLAGFCVHVNPIAQDLAQWVEYDSAAYLTHDCNQVDWSDITRAVTDTALTKTLLGPGSRIFHRIHANLYDVEETPNGQTERVILWAGHLANAVHDFYGQNDFEIVALILHATTVADQYQLELREKGGNSSFMTTTWPTLQSRYIQIYKQGDNIRATVWQTDAYDKGALDDGCQITLSGDLDFDYVSLAMSYGLAGAEVSSGYIEDVVFGSHQDLYAKFEIIRAGAAELDAELEVRSAGTEELLAKLLVGGEDSEELLAKLEVKNASAQDLFAKLESQQSASAELLGKTDIQHSDSTELLGKFQVSNSSSAELFARGEIQQSGSAELLGKTDVQQSGSVELSCNADIQHASSIELLGKADIQHSSSAELLAKFEITGILSDSEELLGKTNIQQSGSVELLAKFETGKLGSAELLGKADIQHSASAELLGKADIQQSGSVELLGKADIQQSSSAELLGRLQVRISSSAELLGKLSLQFSGSVGLYARFEVGQDIADLLGKIDIRKETTVEFLGRFYVEVARDFAELPSIFWVRQPYRLWTNRRYLNGVVELSETLLGNAILEYVIDGVMQDIQSYLINCDISYSTWTDITLTPVLIRRATTYGVVASLFARKTKTFTTRVIPTMAPVTITAIGDGERAMNHWRDKMNKALEYYVSSQSGAVMISSTEDEEPVFSMEDIPPEVTDYTPWYEWLMRRQQ